MQLTNPGKFWLLLVTLVGLLGLVALERITFSDASPFLAAVIGYGLGNGVAAVKRQNSPPVFSPKPEE